MPVAPLDAKNGLLALRRTYAIGHQQSFVERDDRSFKTDYRRSPRSGE